jgi:hypothetical protein
MELFSQDPHEMVKYDSLSHVPTTVSIITPSIDASCVEKVVDACMNLFVSCSCFLSNLVSGFVLTCWYLFIFVAIDQPKAMEAATPPLPLTDAQGDHLVETLSPHHPIKIDSFWLET